MTLTVMSMDEIDTLFKTFEQRTEDGDLAAFENLLLELNDKYAELSSNQKANIRNKLSLILEKYPKFDCNHIISYSKKMMSGSRLEYEECIRLVCNFYELEILNLFDLVNQDKLNDFFIIFENWGKSQKITTVNVINALIAEDDFIKKYTIRKLWQ